MEEDFIQIFARVHLGPESALLVEMPEVEESIKARMASGTSPEDAVLAEVHARCSSKGNLADEFIRYFLRELMGMKVLDLYPVLRRHLDTMDVVQSVLADLWPDLAELEFRNRVSFLSLLSKRLKWKSLDKKQALLRDRRREDLRAFPEMEVASNSHDIPSENLEKEEERDVLLMAVLRLPPRDRTLVQRYLQGVSGEDIAREFGLKPASARKALSRALEMARTIARGNGD